MQSTLPSLPKLYHIRYNPQTTPELRHGDILHVSELFLYVLDPLLQYLPSPFLLRQDLTLLAGPSPDSRTSRSQAIVCLTFLLAQHLRLPLYPNLPLELRPPERQTSAWIGRNVRCLSTGTPVAVYDKTARVEFFQVDVAGGDGPGGEVCGGEADGLGLVDLGLLSVSEPGVELSEWGGDELVPL